MDRFHNINPFVKRETYSPRTVIAYKVLTILTWLLSVVTTLYYTVDLPGHPKYYRNYFWFRNYRYFSGFTQHHIVTSIYWIILFIFQLGYLAHLFSAKVEKVNAACSVGSHFIFNNLLHFAFVMLFVHSDFVWAEVILVINFFNLSSLYFRHNTYPRFIHLPAVSGPLAWTFVAIYWNGGIMVPHGNTLVARIFANIFIWSILGYGMFFIGFYKDYTMGFNLSILATSIGVAQFLHKAVELQWIFSFTIMAVLFVSTLFIAVPAWTGTGGLWTRRQETSGSAPERAPLLGDNAA